MTTALVVGLVVAALLGVGLVAGGASMVPGGMGTPSGGMIGGGMMDGGMMDGDMQGMHDGMQGMDHDSCHCCQGGDDPNT